MSLIKLNRRFPFFDQLFPDIIDTDRLYTENLNIKDNWIPAMNVKENDLHFEIEVSAPGFEKPDFEVSVTNGILTIAAENKHSMKKKEEEFSRQEFYYNSFSRSFTLPKSIDFKKKITADYMNGVLRIHLMKLDEKKDEEQRKIIDIA